VRAPWNIVRETIRQFLARALPAARVWVAILLASSACGGLLARGLPRTGNSGSQEGAKARSDNFAAAIAKYQQALRTSPHDVNAEIGLAEAYRAVHNYDEAKNILERAAREHPKNEAPLVILGDLEIELQTYAAAIQHLAAALALKPEDTSARIWLAVAYKSKGDLTNALAQLGEVLAREPQNALAYYERAQIYSDQNRDIDALRDATRAVELKPNSPDRLLLAKILVRPPAGGDAAIVAKRCSHAAEMLEPVASVQPADSEPSGSKPDDATRGGSETLFLLARAYQCAGQNERAQKTLAEFASASNNERTAKENQLAAKHLVQQANDAAMKNDFRGAADLLQQALEKDPSYGAAYSQLAKLYYSAGDMEKASDAIAKALAREPYQPDFLYVQGKVLEKEGKLDEALAAFERTTLVNPKESDAYFEMGAIYQQRNDRARALAAYKKAVELSPDDADYRRALAAMH
jgi:tetratricopeptide (TPR) repeat protein